jgi:hypothetical protein
MLLLTLDQDKSKSSITIYLRLPKIGTLGSKLIHNAFHQLILGSYADVSGKHN